MGNQECSPDFKVLFEAAPGLYLVLAPSLTIIAVSEAYLQATMTKRQDILGQGLFEVFPDNPNDPTATGVNNLRASLARVLKNKTSDAMAVQKYDIRRPESKGGGFEERYWSPVNSPVLNKNGDVIYIIHRVEDVTEFISLKKFGLEQGRANEELRIRADKMESEIFFRAQQLQEANKQLRESEGKLEQRVQERTQELAKANAALQEEMAQRQRREEEKRQLDLKIQRMQRLENLGALAGGIAHDLNNVLGPISIAVHLLRQAALSPRENKMLNIIEMGSKRGADMVKQILTFARGTDGTFGLVQPSNLLLEMTDIVIATFPKSIHIENECNDDLWPVSADATKIHQVLLNLCVNARDAMPKGGKLTLQAKNLICGEDFTLDDVDFKPGRYVLIIVSDSGVGMTPDVMQKAFDPFFTTKKDGKGTGLGLSTVADIIKSHGGFLRIKSKVGKGSEFQVYLPAMEALHQNQNKIILEIPPGQGELVLVVDDEISMRHMTQASLESYGYKAAVARDGAEAVALLTQSLGKVHIVLCDMEMPNLDGKSTIKVLRKLDPKIKIIGTSGSPFNQNLKVDLRMNAFLPKPYTTEELFQTLHEVLANPT